MTQNYLAFMTNVPYIGTFSTITTQVASFLAVILIERNISQATYV